MRLKKKTSKKRAKKTLRKARARKKIQGTEQKPRLNLFKGSTSLYAQVVDDLNSKTLLGVSTASKAVADIKGKNKESAIKLGKLLAERCKEKGISEVVFDKGGNKYHGVVKAFADAARENGIKF